MQIEPSLPAGHRVARLAVEHLHVIPRHRDGGRPRLDRQQLDALGVAGDRPAGLGLPPVVDDRHTEGRRGPLVRVRVEPLAREVEGAEGGQVVVLDERRRRVLLLDGAEGRRRREQADRSVLGDDAPEGTGVRRPDRLALVEHRRRAGQQRPVDDVGVADDPADVARGEHRLARLHVVEVGHRPAQRHGVATAVAVDPLRLTGRARGVEDVERVGRGDRDAGPPLPGAASPDSNSPQSTSRPAARPAAAGAGG